MKKKGFTLIELLAVIVILAVIALIATPIILGVIDNVKKEAFRDTAYGISKAADNLYVSNLYKGNKLGKMVFNYLNGTESSVPNGLVLKYNGTKPKNGQVIINETGKIALALHDGKWCAFKEYSESTIEVEERTLEECFIDDEMAGSGTEEDPYVIMTERQLYSVRNELDAHYVLGNNITLTKYQEGTGFTPIGTSAAPFTGSFNGNGRKITDLFINNSIDNVGLFGYISGATIENINLENLNITGNSCTGGLIGKADNNSVIDNIIIEGNVTGTSNTGGLIGCLTASTVTNNYADVNTTGSSTAIGGLIGYVETSNNVNINKTLASGNVTSTGDYVGGLIGQFGTGSGATVNLSNSYAISPVQGANYVGGLVGYSNYASITNTYAVGLITTTSKPGGLVARASNTTATNSYWSTDTTKILNSAIGISSSLLEMLSKTTAYNNWDFVSIWDIEEGDTLAYLRGMPTPNEIYKEELGYIDYGTELSGSGTKADPYIIVNETQLNDVRNKLSAHYKLGANITLTSYQSGSGFTPIGTSSTPFTGSLDGNGYKIINLYINRNANYNGLFGYTNGATIKNLTLENVDISNTSSSASTSGGLVGYGANTTIEKVSVSGMVKGYTNVGGLVGQLASGTITKSFTNVAVTSTTSSGYAGGLIGLTSGSSGARPNINNSYALGSVQANASSGTCGGVIGKVSYTTIINTYAAVPLTCNTKGGLVGNSDANSSANNSYWSSEIAGVTNSALGTNKLFSGLLKKAIYGNEWDFIDIWDIEEGETLAYLRGMPIPNNIYADNYTYIDYQLGAGTEADPYIITTAEQLNGIRNDLSSHYRLGANINLSSYKNNQGFVPIGVNQYEAFTGSLDGNGYKITDLYVNRSTNYNGLFGYTIGATIKNLILEGVNIPNTGGASDNVGGLIGRATETTVERVGVSGTVKGYIRVGGLVGSFNGIITECFANVTVVSVAATQYAHTGGLIGSMSGPSTVSNSYAFGSVQGSTSNGGVGGLIGGSGNSTIENSYAVVTLTGYTKGGLIGINTNNTSTGTSSYWDTTVSGITTSALGTGKTTAEMQQIDTYSDWDFDNVWNITSGINNGYPKLRWED